jgi:hypothetical protein
VACHEHLTDRQVAKLNTCLEAGDPNHEVTVAWSTYQQLRQAYATKGSRGRQIAEKIIASFPACPIPEVARLGRTLRQWRQQVLAYFDTRGVSNGGTEAINLWIDDQPLDREDKTPHTSLPQLRQLPPAHPARRRRIALLPPPPEPRSMTKSLVRSLGPCNLRAISLASRKSRLGRLYRAWANYWLLDVPRGRRI